MKRMIITLALVAGLAGCQSPQDQAIATLEAAAQAGRLSGAQSLQAGDNAPHRLFAGGVDEASRFRIASLTKLFTQIAILRLVDGGALDLDQTLASVRPGLDADWAGTVTLRQLLNFSSGLPREPGAEGEGVIFDEDGYALAFMDTLGDLGPQSEPGSRTAYSNLGYMHLGAVIEAVTGRTYAEAIDALVAAPAGLTDTGFGVDVLGEDRHLHGYAGPSLERVSGHPISQRYSTGGLYASLRDLERLSDAIREPGYLSETAQQELFTQFGRPDARDPSYLLATGHVPGFTHAWVIARDPAFTIISLNNRLAGNERDVPDIVTAAAAALHPGMAEREDRYRPTPQDGWAPISRLSDIPDQPVLPRLADAVTAILSGDVMQTRDAAMRLHGYDPATAEASDLEDFAGFAGAYVRIANDYGPFRPIAWRMDGARLQIYLESEDEQRGIHFAATPSEADPSRASSVSLGTYGFEP
ncbi:serine hydrolase domain-containing protein [Maricaulis sp.]|uniref:serine hydrolase domain-containing protein n=1 Tax=Maricaulis sp. TaxID=1486257 RepID=UPI003298049A